MDDSYESPSDYREVPDTQGGTSGHWRSEEQERFVRQQRLHLSVSAFANPVFIAMGFRGPQVRDVAIPRFGKSSRVGDDESLPLQQKARHVTIHPPRLSRHDTGPGITPPA